MGAAGEAPGRFAEPAGEGRLRCLLCPHRCLIAPGAAGLCRVRENRDGALFLPRRGRLSGAALDPMEKKPLYHFLPGSAVWSVGFFGCNLRCPFCQNWEISQTAGTATKALSAAELVRSALESGAPALAFTYSEPLVHIEFLLEAAAAAREAGLATVLVTNGCILEEPALELLPLIDAVNLDIKAWSAEAYSRILAGDREAVLDFARLAAGLCHLEATSLVVPGLDDWLRAIPAIAAFLAELSPDIPLHLSAYRPAWRHAAPATPSGLLDSLAVLASEPLRYVYLGNVPGGGSDSLCPVCGAVAVRRRSWSVEPAGLRPSGRPARVGKAAGLRGASCAACGRELPFILAAEGGKVAYSP